MNIQTKFTSLLTALALAPTCLSAATSLIDVDFESGTLSDNNLASRGSNSQTIGDGLGTGNPASKGVNSNKHGALVHTTTRAIDAQISFSVDARWTSGDPVLNRQALLVGWTRHTGSFNTYEGGTDTQAIGLKTTTVDGTSGDQVSFAYGNATNTSQGIALGASTATMVDGNWYRFSGTINYNGAATAGQEFTFTNLVLANIGADGLGPATTVLSGSFTDGYVWGGGNWQTAATTAASLVVISGYQGGVSNIDNYSVTVIPEPRTALLIGLGALLLLLRRRRCA